MDDRRPLPHLTPNEQSALMDFVAWLQDTWGDRITHVWLFGSKARVSDSGRGTASV